MEEKRYCYKYPHPAVTADCCVFAFDGKELNILLVKRRNAPYKDCWAFPGGFMEMNETIEQCAARELEEETDLTAERLEQLMCFSSVARDPRERVITIAFLVLVSKQKVKGGDDAQKAEWFKLSNIPPLAFDHDYILRIALNKLKERVHFEPVCFELLGEQFTMSELQRLYEMILGVRFDRRNFARKIMSWGILERMEENNSGQKQLTKSDSGDFSSDFSSNSLYCPKVDKRTFKEDKKEGILRKEDFNLHKGLIKTPSKGAFRYKFNREQYEKRRNGGFRMEF